MVVKLWGVVGIGVVWGGLVKRLKGMGLGEEVWRLGMWWCEEGMSRGGKIGERISVVFLINKKNLN